MTRTRQQCRAGNRCEPDSLIEVACCLVQHSDMDAKEIAERTGISYGYLLNACNPNLDTHNLQAKHLLVLMTVTGNDAPLRFMCRMMGGYWVPPAKYCKKQAPHVRQAFVRVMKEVAKDAELIERVLSDGKVSQKESHRAAAKIDDTIDAVLHVRAHFQHRIEANQRSNA